jgi:hypothetical protein
MEDESWEKYLDTSIDRDLDNTAARSSEIDYPDQSTFFDSPKASSTPKLNRKPNLQRKQINTAIPQNFFKCIDITCKKSFKTAAGLKRHMRIHRLAGRLMALQLTSRLRSSLRCIVSHYQCNCIVLDLRLNIVSQEDMAGQFPLLAVTVFKNMKDQLQSSSCGLHSEALVALAESCSLSLEEEMPPSDLMNFVSAVGTRLLPCIFAEAASVNIESSEEASLIAFNVLMADTSYVDNCHETFIQYCDKEVPFNLFLFKFSEQLQLHW